MQLSFEQFENAVIEMPIVPAKKTDLSSKDYGSIYASILRKSIIEETSPFLPNKDGIIDLKPTYNLSSNEVNTGLFQIMLLERQYELNSPSPAFVTKEVIESAKRQGLDLSIKNGEKGFDLIVEKKDSLNIKTFFNICQIENPENLKIFCQPKTKNQVNRDNHQNTKIGKMNFTTPEMYFGQVLAAMDLGIKLVVTDEEKERFKNITLDALNKKRNGKIDSFAILKMAQKANTYYRNIKLNLEQSKQFQKKEHQTQRKKAENYYISR